MKMVVYDGCGEVLVCALHNEHRLLKEFFEDGGRDTEEYDRSVVGYYVQIAPRLRVDVSE